jgi:rhodanese-related sulfurtransferase
VKNGKAVATGASANSANPKASSSASAGTGTTTSGTGTGTTTSATGPVTGVVVNLAGDHSNQAALGALTAFGIVLAVALPPGLAAWLRRRRGQARG